MKVKKTEQEKIKEQLTEWDLNILRNIQGQKIYCNITKVSNLGMTRKMRFFSIPKGQANEDLINITHLISIIADYKLDKNHDLIVSGCGMDMIFSVLSNFNYAMARFNNYQKKEGERIYDTYWIDADHYNTL
jgi:hypothetical protein